MKVNVLTILEFAIHFPVALFEKLEKSVGIAFQRIALTATVGNPDDMLKWLAGSNREPGKRIYVSSARQKEND